MTSTHMHALHYQGYAQALFIVELALITRWFFSNESPPVRGLAAICLIAFLQGCLTFDYVFITAGAAIPLMLLAKAYGRRVDKRAVVVIVIASALSYLTAHLLHFWQVAHLYGSFSAALQDLSVAARHRFGADNDMPYAAKVLAVLITYGQILWFSPTNQHFGPLLVFVSGATCIRWRLNRMEGRNSPFGLRGIAGAGTARPALIRKSYGIAALWLFAMPSHALIHVHFIPRHFFLAYFVAVLDVALRLNAWQTKSQEAGVTIPRKLALDYYLGSFLHVLLKPFTVLLGILLRRDHDLSHCSSVTFIKMLGGGSLVIAYPSLVALRNCPRIRTLRLVTTPAIRPFAEILGVFDEIIVIRETSLAVMAHDSIRALWKLFLCDAIVDLEVHSRLSTVLSLLTCARNRVGFYTSIAFWRKGLSTHLIFCNLSNSIHYFYDQIASLFGAAIPSVDTFREVFTSQLPEPAKRALPAANQIAIAPCCSELGQERQLTGAEWLTILRDRVRIGQVDRNTEIYLMGSPSDRTSLSALGDLISGGLPGVKTHNLAGLSTLAESVAWLQQMNLLFCIDSAMLHFGRLIGVTTISYWGPTSPATRLRPDMVPAEEVFYRPIPCSPCVHVTESPPCNGDSICMRVTAAVHEPVAGLNQSGWWVLTRSRARKPVNWWRSKQPLTAARCL